MTAVIPATDGFGRTQMFRTRSDEGFGLVEVVIAMMLLAIIAVALLPFLARGISQSSTQSVTATATRELNSLIEEARTAQTCAKVNAIRAIADPYFEGTNREFSIEAPTAGGRNPTCTPKTAVQVSLDAVHDSSILVRVDAIIYVKQ
ncbi:type IV pilus modification PilV family protein [Microbacterium esteraromaticum]|uniref:type IV pilus modification PilV family protein n=1 Tax=Microbacterium esteraromaticum TaxID=57043 RepID=UPI00195EEF9F|nr:type II secretion system protein [Microbacterium esteraromaticum]MBM7465807.1 prepilin-type N-terminal cleavage/methylation domain-containing protein [Microbacterium esteraromaticum]